MSAGVCDTQHPNFPSPSPPPSHPRGSRWWYCVVCVSLMSLLSLCLSAVRMHLNLGLGSLDMTAPALAPATRTCDGTESHTHTSAGCLLSQQHPHPNDPQEVACAQLYATRRFVPPSSASLIDRCQSHDPTFTHDTIVKQNGVPSTGAVTGSVMFPSVSYGGSSDVGAAGAEGPSASACGDRVLWFCASQQTLYAGSTHVMRAFITPHVHDDLIGRVVPFWLTSTASGSVPNIDRDWDWPAYHEIPPVTTNITSDGTITLTYTIMFQGSYVLDLWLYGCNLTEMLHPDHDKVQLALNTRIGSPIKVLSIPLTVLPPLPSTVACPMYASPSLYNVSLFPQQPLCPTRPRPSPTSAPLPDRWWYGDDWRSMLVTGRAQSRSGVGHWVHDNRGLTNIHHMYSFQDPYTQSTHLRPEFHPLHCRLDQTRAGKAKAPAIEVAAAAAAPTPLGDGSGSGALSLVSSLAFRNVSILFTGDSMVRSMYLSLLTMATDFAFSSSHLGAIRTCYQQNQHNNTHIPIHVDSHNIHVTPCGAGVYRRLNYYESLYAFSPSLGVRLDYMAYAQAPYQSFAHTTPESCTCLHGRPRGCTVLGVSYDVIVTNNAALHGQTNNLRFRVSLLDELNFLNQVYSQPAEQAPNTTRNQHQQRLTDVQRGLLYHQHTNTTTTTTTAPFPPETLNCGPRSGPGSVLESSVDGGSVCRGVASSMCVGCSSGSVGVLCGSSCSATCPLVRGSAKVVPILFFQTWAQNQFHKHKDVQGKHRYQGVVAKSTFLHTSVVDMLRTVDRLRHEYQELKQEPHDAHAHAQASKGTSPLGPSPSICSFFPESSPFVMCGSNVSSFGALSRHMSVGDAFLASSADTVPAPLSATVLSAVSAGALHLQHSAALGLPFEPHKWRSPIILLNFHPQTMAVPEYAMDSVHYKQPVTAQLGVMLLHNLEVLLSHRDRWELDLPAGLYPPEYHEDYT